MLSKSSETNYNILGANHPTSMRSSFSRIWRDQFLEYFMFEKMMYFKSESLKDETTRHKMLTAMFINDQSCYVIFNSVEFVTYFLPAT